MAYEWHWYDRKSGELNIQVEQGDPCVCVGDDLPHPPRLCLAVFERARALRLAMLDEALGR